MKNEQVRRPIQSQSQAARAQSIKARRQKIRRERALRTFYFLLVVVMLSVLVTLSLTVLFKIENISVVGDEIYTKEQIIEISGLKTGENIFRTDTSAAKQKIEEALSYVESATVRRKLPATIEIEIKKAMPCAAVRTTGQYAIISKTGKVLDVNVTVPEGTPIFEGIAVKNAELGKVLETEREDDLKVLVNIVSVLEDSQLYDINYVNLSSLYNIEFMYNNRIIIQVGSSTDLQDKLVTAKYILDHNIGPEEKGTIDVSMTERSEARFRPESSQAQTSSETQSQTSSQDVDQSASSEESTDSSQA